jgi:prefoldin subunit 5
MAKRSTIGENPLDAVVQENPLDTVVPDLSVVGRSGPGPGASVAPQVEERFQKLEAGLQTLGREVSGLKGAAEAAAAVKNEVAGLQREIAELRRELEQFKAEAAGAGTVLAELTQFKDELNRLRAGAKPGDLPFWMRGWKK